MISVKNEIGFFVYYECGNIVSKCSYYGSDGEQVGSVV